MTSETTPIGWQQDPGNALMERYWDGTSFTMVRPISSQDPQVVTYRTPGALAPTSGVSPKSRTVAAILGFLLGGFAVHRFYLGNVGMAVVMLLVGWLTLFIWNLIDWVIVLAGGARDGNGLPVRTW